MKISVITVTFNSGKTVRDTIESVLRQTHKDIEYIIVDGESQDNTTEIVRSYEPQFGGRMRFVSESDKGIYDAMNKGITMATGEVVGILNSDDFYTSNDVIALVSAALENKEIDAVYGDVHYVNREDLNKCVRYYSSKVFRRSWMRFGFMPAHPSFYCRKSMYERFGGFSLNYKIGADFENLLRLIFVNRISTKYIEKDFVTMRIGGASTSGISSHVQIMCDHQRAFRENGVYSNVFLESLRHVYKIYEIIATRYSTKYNLIKDK